MMSRRADKPDTQADIELRENLCNVGRRNFTMIAGAGSGKTTSLIKALAAVISAHGPQLKKRRQRVACITYTEIAAGEIWADVGNDPRVHVSTIHSFLWAISKTFQSDIREWVLRRIDERILELHSDAAKYGSRVQQRTRDKNRRDIEKYERAKDRVVAVPVFTYGTGANYAKGILGHDDIIRLATDMLKERPLFRALLTQQYPFIFVDESQDTQASVVEALRAAAQQAGSTFCLGLFGDPMQRIYPSGVGRISTDDTWLKINKEENFRCPTSVLAVANAIRAGAGADALVQTGGRTVERDGVSVPVRGSARIFILPADERRNQLLASVRSFVAAQNDDPGWSEGPEFDVKILVIVHRMAANRLGFGALYEAMNDKAPNAFRDGFLDASAWPLRPFERFIMPLAEATKDGREFDAMTILRENSLLLERERLRASDVAATLKQLRQAASDLASMVSVDSQATVRDVLELLRARDVVELDPRLLAYLDNVAPAPPNEGDEDDDAEEQDQLSREIMAMDAYLSCRAAEFVGYRQYLKQESPFSTHQGIKGAEFERVLVVLDDDEGTHVQFSYDKLFGVKELSDRDRKLIDQGEETSVDRTRRLFYVCCTRALSDLVVVYFTRNVDLAENRVRELGLFEEESILNEAALIGIP